MSADLVLTNGRIYTIDPHTPTASAVAIRDGKILAVGQDDAMKSLLGSDGDIDQLNQLNFQRSLEKFKQQGGGFHFGTDMDSWGEQLPPEELREFGHKLALINVDNAQHIARLERQIKDLREQNAVMETMMKHHANQLEQAAAKSGVDREWIERTNSDLREAIIGSKEDVQNLRNQLLKMENDALQSRFETVYCQTEFFKLLYVTVMLA